MRTRAWVGCDGAAWVVGWQSAAMAEPQYWRYATKADAEAIAAVFRGEATAPLPAPEPASRPARP